jgi:hypothetical protein
MNIIQFLIVWYVTGCFSSLLFWVIICWGFCRKDFKNTHPENVFCLITLMSWIGFMTSFFYLIESFKYYIIKLLHKKKNNGKYLY